MSVAATVMKVCFQGFCLYSGVGVFYHWPCSLIVVPLKLDRGMSHHFWVIFSMLVTPAMGLCRWSVSGTAELFGDITAGCQGVSKPGAAC